jgi:two-component sensor histidine kinase
VNVEADHRIANNLMLIAALVRRQAARLPRHKVMTGQEVRGELEQIGARIDAVARLHRLVTRAGSPAILDLGDYLREVAQITFLSLADANRASLSLDLASGCAMSAKQSVSVGLIVGEAMTNALKYAHPTGVDGKIFVGCRRQKKNAIVVEIADDGVGLPVGFSPGQNSAVGLGLMHSLASQLAATLEFRQRAIGLCIRLTIPDAAPALAS